jgi:hypothetical protein
LILTVTYNHTYFCVPILLCLASVQPIPQPIMSSDHDTIEPATNTKESVNPWDIAPGTVIRAERSTITLGDVLKEGRDLVKDLLHLGKSDQGSSEPDTTTRATPTATAPSSSASQSGHIPLTNETLAELNLRRIKPGDGCEPRGRIYNPKDLTTEGLQGRFPGSNRVGSRGGTSGAQSSSG